jgi:DNA-binding CsgD family transcriptional regulator
MSEASLRIRLACDLPFIERQVLEQTAMGRVCKEIKVHGEQKAQLSQKGIEYHKLRLRRRTDLHHDAQLTKLALRLGLAEIDV